MRMRVTFAVAGLALGSLLSAAVAQAATYDLSTDLYTANAPGSAWAITYNSAPLPLRSGALNNNHLFPVTPSDGVFAGGSSDPTDYNDGGNTPFVFRASQDGHFSTYPGQGSLTDNDFLAGDVVVHSPNANTAVTIFWTAPTAGVLDNLALSVWYAHSNVPLPGRSNDVTLDYTGNPGAPLSWVTSAVLNSHRTGAGGTTLGPVSFNAGDLLTLTFMKTAGQSFGSLSALNLAFDFQATAVTPVPPALPLFVSALAGLGWFAHRRRRGQAA
jgi:hypothetical protein